MELFTSTLNQTAFLFALIIIGFVLGKCKFIPENSATVLSKLENMVFVPGLVMGTFINNFTVEKIASAGRIMLAGFVLIFIMIPIAILISKCLSRDKYEQNIYTYGLAFSNFGFMGNAVVKALFPEIFLEYIIFTIPLWIMIYLWAVPVLLISDSGEKQTLKKRLKSFVNPMFIAMIIGMIIGILGIKLPQWASSVITVSGDCMSPVAMLLTGITVSSIDLKKTFSTVRVYIASIIRLVVIPLAFLAVAHFVEFERTIYICSVCALAMPLGLNTIVVPKAYGKDTSEAAGMAIISHLLSCIAIPAIFMMMNI